MNKSFYWMGILFLGLYSLGCSSGSSSSTSSSVSVSSLSSIPDIADLVSASSSSANLSALRMKAAVSGTAPVLTSITPETADTLFWNGLISEINTSGFDPADMDDFWQGEGKCRMAQSAGYSFQNIIQAGTSICYMKNAPTASSGVELVTGTGTAATALDQTANTKVVKITVTNTPGEDSGDEDLYIRVYGSGTTTGANGYAADLWFCSVGEDTPNGREEIRVNSSTGVFTQTSVNDRDGQRFAMIAEAILDEDSEGNIIFDTTAERSAEVYFNGTFGETSNTFKSLISLDATYMTSKELGIFGSFTNKNYVVSSISGDDMDTLRFLEAGFAGQSSFDSVEQDAYYGATEFQDTRYTTVGSGTLYDLVNEYDFGADTFYANSFTTYTALIDEISTEDCSATADIELTMDFDDTALQTVTASCENDFSNMNFCESEDIQNAREAVFASF